MIELDINIVFVNYKKYGLSRKFLQTFYNNEPSSQYTLTMFDNESDPGQALSLKNDYRDVDVHASGENVGYAKACNYGASLGDARYIGLFNNDIEFVNPTCIDQCIHFMDENPDVAIVGPFQYSTIDGRRRVTNAGIIGPGDAPKHRGWLENDKGQYRFNEQVLMIMGSAMIIRREFWDKMMEDEVFRSHFPNALGAMPETPLYYEDTALCYAAPYFGYKVYYLGEPGCELVHQWHQTIKDAPVSEHFETSRGMFRSLMYDWGILCD